MDGLALEQAKRLAGALTALLDCLCSDFHRDSGRFHPCVAHCSGRGGSVGRSGLPVGYGCDQCAHDRFDGGSRDPQRLDPLPGQLPGSAGPGLPGQTRFNATDHHGGDHLCHSSLGLLSRVLAHPGWRHADTRRSLGRTAFPAWHLFCSSKKFACHHQQRPGGRCYQPGFDPDPLGTCFRTCPSGELAVCACPVPQWTPFRTGPAGLNLRRGVCLLFWPLLGEQLCQNRSAA